MVAKAHELNPPLSIYTYAHSITGLNKIWLKAVQELGPNSLIFSFSSGASPAHNAGGQVLPLFSQQVFLTKEVGKRDGKMVVAHYLPC